MGICALEKLVKERWIPVAIRGKQFTTSERKELNAGLVVNRDGESFRRTDFAQRAAEISALKRAMHQSKV